MPRRIFNSIEEFRAAARAGDPDFERAADAPAESLPTLKPGVEVKVLAGCALEVTKAEGKERTLVFSISSAAVDRYGDTIAVEGWKLTDYRNNPVVLWAHDSDERPVGKSLREWKEAGKLKSECEFVPAATPEWGPFCESIYQLYLGGFLNATSVGFMPLKYAYVDDPERRYGIDFLEQDLLEYSCVPVPANPEALVEGRSAGIDMAPVLNWCESVLSKNGNAERIIKLAESVLGKTGSDLIDITWAERIVAASGRAIISKARLEGIERAAKHKRLADARRRELDLIRLGSR